VVKDQIVKLMVAIAFAAAVVAGTITSCDDNNGFAAPGGPGIGGTSGGAAGGTGGLNQISYDVTLTGMEIVPATNSAGSARVTLTLNKTTGDIMVTGLFGGLSAPATEAHIHGPAAVGSTGPVLLPLTVTPDMSGALTGGAPMNAAQMSEMLNGMTYVDIHSTYFPDGEIRAQLSNGP
jgi:hypothetical protein